MSFQYLCQKSNQHSIMNILTILKNQKLIIIGATLGAVIGFFYWKEIGCLSGNCTIKSVWYNMTAYGLTLGGLFSSIIQEQFKKKK